MNTNLQKIGELLAQCRKNKGLTQEEVGVMIGVQKAMVSKVENGLCVNFGTVNRIAEALGVEPVVALKSKKKADKNLIDYVMTVIVEFARRHPLGRHRECREVSLPAGCRSPGRSRRDRRHPL